MTQAEFQEWRDRLKTTLKPGTQIHHWSYDDRHQDKTFTVDRAYDDQLVLKTPHRYIPWQDFFAILQDWPNYTKGIIPRKKIVERTRHATYVIGIIHWLEKNSK